MSAELARLRKERDLYQRCLDLCQTNDPAPLLTEAVRVLCELAGAELGYIEIVDTITRPERRWSADVGVAQGHRELIQARVSRGIIAEAIETGETLHIPDALLDERFGDRESVRSQNIKAVLCVPLRDEGVVGVVYLQRGSGETPGDIRFAPDDVERVETVAGFVGSVAGRLLELMRRRDSDDATSGVRARLRADSLIGRTPAVAELLARLEVVASLQANVLIVGATGTGKSLLARLLHENSSRGDGPFVEINCASLPDTLIESELFGAAKGAHSGASDQSIPGKVSAAEGGTLFLDEVAEIPVPVQAKLLQLLQSKQYYRLGADSPTQADIRIVAATNRDLSNTTTDGALREDLYYRLRGVQLAVPDLAHRRGDAPLLAEHFCAKACTVNNLPPMTFSPAALAAIEFADWPGNVRQLENRCQDALVSARMEGATTIEVRHVFPKRDETTSSETQTFQAFRDARDKEFLARELAARDWNVAQTARELEVSRSQLNVLIRRYDLRRG